MKHKVITVLCIIAIVAVGITVNAEHQHEKRILNRQAVASAKAAQAIQTEHDNSAKLLQLEILRLHGECVKGATAFNLLTVAQRSKMQAPACGDEIVQ